MLINKQIYIIFIFQHLGYIKMINFSKCIHLPVIFIIVFLKMVTFWGTQVWGLIMRFWRIHYLSCYFIPSRSTPISFVMLIFFIFCYYLIIKLVLYIFVSILIADFAVRVHHLIFLSKCFIVLEYSYNCKVNVNSHYYISTGFWYNILSYESY